MRKYAQCAAAVAGALFVLAVMLWVETSAVDQCRRSELPCDEIAKQYAGH